LYLEEQRGLGAGLLRDRRLLRSAPEREQLHDEHHEEDKNDGTGNRSGDQPALASAGPPELSPPAGAAAELDVGHDASR
jgi:hypothetical protein